MEAQERNDNKPYFRFLLKEIAVLENGNKFDKNKMTHISPQVNFVSRTSTNNGISDVVDYCGIEPYCAGCITLAFGGSIGSCFVQTEPFYTGQNIGVIILPPQISLKAKMFFAASLAKQCKAKYVAFGDEINKHFKTDLSILLPVNNKNEIDWKYMEERISELEAERISELEAYLVATGLDDYELTEEDKEILASALHGGKLTRLGIWKIVSGMGKRI